MQKRIWFVLSFEHVNFAINGKYSNYYALFVIFQTCKYVILRNVDSFEWLLWLCFYPMEICDECLVFFMLKNLLGWSINPYQHLGINHLGHVQWHHIAFEFLYPLNIQIDINHLWFHMLILIVIKMSYIIFNMNDECCAFMLAKISWCDTNQHIGLP
jgi:hypothetical protein